MHQPIWLSRGSRQYNGLLIEEDPDDIGLSGHQTFVIDFHCHKSDALESTLLLSLRQRSAIESAPIVVLRFFE
jgi:hypothetical protein